MAIVKNSFKAFRSHPEFSSHSREGMSSEDEQILRCGLEARSDDDDMFNECDSGAGSDDFDLLELGEVGEEFCQVGDQTCSIPFELYDLSGLGEILSMDVWNECLTEEERFSLTKHLPDMDQETYLRTLKQLFTGSSLHFGSPLIKLFDMLKGGLCEPKVALYRQGLMSFQKRQHCHLVRKYHNSMVVNFHQVRDAWLSYNGYSIEEKLQVLNIMKSQKSLMNENMVELGSDASEGGTFRSRKENSKFPYQGKVAPLKEESLQKPYSKGLLNSGGKKTSSTSEVGRRFPSSYNGLEMTAGPSSSSFGASTRQYKFSGYGTPMTDPMEDEDVEETAYATAFQRGNSTLQASALNEAGSLRTAKTIEGLRDGEYNTDYVLGYHRSSMKDLQAYEENRTVDKLSDIRILMAKASNNGKQVEYPSNVQQFPVGEKLKYGQSHAQNSLTKGSWYEPCNEPFWQDKAHGDALSVDMPTKYKDHTFESKNLKIGRGSSNYKFDDRPYFPEYGAKLSQGNIRENSMQNGGLSTRYRKGEETGSDSPEPVDDDDDNNPLMRSKLAYPRETLNGSFINSEHKFERAAVSQKGKKGGARHFDELSHFSRNMDHSHNSAFKDGLFSDSGRCVTDDRRQVQNFSKKMRLQGAYSSGDFVPNLKSYPTGRKQKEIFGHPLHEYVLDDEKGSFEARPLVDDTNNCSSFGKKGNVFETYGGDFHEKNNVPSSFLKSRESEVAPFVGQDGIATKYRHLLESTATLRRQEIKNGNSGSYFAEMGNTAVEQEPRSQKKPFTPITPTVHTGFSFSVVHLLSAVRMAMVTLLPEDSLEIGGTNGVNVQAGLDINKSEPSLQSKAPSLTVQEIINRVRSNPGDPCILETQEPLQDLVRGVLKILSSKTAPLGAKGWKPLASFEKSTKSWSWSGPVPQRLSDHEVTEEVTSSQAWLLPHSMLVKLVDAFANWLKSSQETLQQIGSLPNPPLSLMQFNVDEKERFKDLRAQKSLNTISPSTEDIRDYFRKEEFLRYSIPDRAFSYTAIDGKKSIVAPLRRCSGKATSKARDHFMLKPDRPPHVTILCLVRDAAARLPGSIGTRSDVCTLIRDSLYIVEQVSDAQVNQVVSGALDRLHYERDPCVQYDGERKLWVYLHRDREEEDFEDDGTSSTKKWRKPKKEAAPEPFEPETVPPACHGGGEQSGLELGSDLNGKPSYGDEHKAVEPFYSDGNHKMEANIEIGSGSDLGAMHQSSTMAWESLGLTLTQGNRLSCQEKSKNDDFGDETFVCSG